MFHVFFPIESGNGSRACQNITVIDDPAIAEDRIFSIHIVASDENVLLHNILYALVSVLDIDGKIGRGGRK